VVKPVAVKEVKMELELQLLLLLSDDIANSPCRAGNSTLPWLLALIKETGRTSVF
jgi:hypothetical protein